MQSQDNSQRDLKKRCFNFSVEIINFLETLSKDNIDQVLVKQLLRSATSIGANIVEAHGSASKKDFQNYFSIAFKSAKETHYWLYLLKETKKGEQVRLDVLLEEITQLSKIIAASILTMKGKR